MKDGFDKSVAERMPKMQKRRPIRPWNVDPVLIKSQDDHKEKRPEPVSEPVARVIPEAPEPEAMNPEPMVMAQASVAKAVETIEDLNTEFSQIIFEKKDIQRKLHENSKVLDVVEKENLSLRQNLAEMEKAAHENTLFEREITFLNEQLEDADFYIQNVVGMLEEKNTSLAVETQKRETLEEKLRVFGRDIQEKAKLDVKVSILEKDLTMTTGRIRELETQLEDEYRKRKPLEDEIVELKMALDKVYSSLSHIRLKAKREVYGS
jgi:chromosome segregation ATPase